MSQEISSRHEGGAPRIVQYSHEVEGLFFGLCASAMSLPVSCYATPSTGSMAIMLSPSESPVVELT